MKMVVVPPKIWVSQSGEYHYGVRWHKTDKFITKVSDVERAFELTKKYNGQKNNALPAS
jgi:hypothetical protein